MLSKLTDEQAEARNHFSNGLNIFLHGPAGSGKVRCAALSSRLIAFYKRRKKKQKKTQLTDGCLQTYLLSLLITLAAVASQNIIVTTTTGVGAVVLRKHLT